MTISTIKDVHKRADAQTDHEKIQAEYAHFRKHQGTPSEVGYLLESRYPNEKHLIWSIVTNEEKQGRYAWSR